MSRVTLTMMVNINSTDFTKGMMNLKICHSILSTMG